MIKKKRLWTLVLAVALVFTCAFPGAMQVSAETKSASVGRPAITEISATENKVTLKWSKVKGADKYKVYRRATKTEWQLFRTVKKTSANKKKYSNTAKYKLKVSGKKYKVYKKASVKYWKLIKSTTGRKLTFKGKYDTTYRFAVKACKGKKHGKLSKVRKVTTESEFSFGPWTGDDDDYNWDRDKEKAFVDLLQGDLKETGENVRVAALELYKALASADILKGRNNMISPVSFMAAMGMLRNGAKGQTLEEIDKAFGTDTEAFNEWFKNWVGLASLKGDTLKLADSVWVKDSKDLVVNEVFRNRVKEVYDAEYKVEPFDKETVKKINDWVNEKTDGMIPSVVDDLSEETVMALINATCFHGKWVDPFEDYAIEKDKDFTREDGNVDKVDMMHSGENRFFENDYLTGTFKEYRKGYKIMFMLPKENVTVKEALDSLQGDDLYKLGKNAEYCNVRLTVPKFEFDYTAPNCIKSLMDMGISTVFDPENADLTGMATDVNGFNLFVSNIIHKTHIDLNENGTDAAAVTAIIIDKASAAPSQDIKEVCLDRPFIFAIMDDTTGTPIFMGTVQSIG